MQLIDKAACHQKCNEFIECALSFDDVDAFLSDQATCQHSHFCLRGWEHFLAGKQKWSTDSLHNVCGTNDSTLLATTTACMTTQNKFPEEKCHGNGCTDSGIFQCCIVWHKQTTVTEQQCVVVFVSPQKVHKQTWPTNKKTTVPTLPNDCQWFIWQILLDFSSIFENGKATKLKWWKNCLDSGTWPFAIPHFSGKTLWTVHWGPTDLCSI